MHASDATPVCFQKYWQRFLLIFFFNIFAMLGNNDKVHVHLNPTLRLPCSYSHLFSAWKGAIPFFIKKTLVNAVSR